MNRKKTKRNKQLIPNDDNNNKMVIALMRAMMTRDHSIKNAKHTNETKRRGKINIIYDFKITFS